MVGPADREISRHVVDCAMYNLGFTSSLRCEATFVF